MRKFKRMAKTLPSMYKAEVNTMVKGLLESWGLSDDEIEVQLQQTKESLFVEDAEDRFLDALGNNVGVSRSSELGLNDDDFRQLIPILSYEPKQVRQTIISLLDVFWGTGFTRANVNSGNTETFNFGPETTLTGTATFVKGEKVVKGSGTLFTSELSVGDYIKPIGSDGTEYAKVSNIVDNESLELSLDWESDFAGAVGVSKGEIRTLSYEVDERESKTIRFIPNAFSDLTAVTSQELVDFINNQEEHNSLLTASVFVDPVAGNKLNLRTNTPGVQGSIQITGGTANDPSRLNFTGNVADEVRAAVFEINPNEIVVQIPSSVPVLRRVLQGSWHPKQQKTEIFSAEETFDFSILGSSSTLEIEIDGSPNTVTFNHSSDFDDDTRVTNEEIARIIDNQLTFMQAFTECTVNNKRVGLRTTQGSSEYQITGGTANSVLNFDTNLQQDPDIIQTDFPSSYVFDPTGQLFTVTGTNAKLTQSVPQGTVQSSLSLDDAASFPNEPGQIIFDFGRSEQEGPISYNNRPNNSTLLIDASYVFEKTHSSGRFVNFVVPTPTIPRVTGEDYPVFIVGTEEARTAAQEIIQQLLASGVVIRFQISFPEVLFECTCQGCGPPDEVDYRGALTASDPLVF